MLKLDTNNDFKQDPHSQAQPGLWEKKESHHTNRDTYIQTHCHAHSHALYCTVQEKTAPATSNNNNNIKENNCTAELKALQVLYVALLYMLYCSTPST